MRVVAILAWPQQSQQAATQMQAQIADARTQLDRLSMAA